MIVVARRMCDAACWSIEPMAKAGGSNATLDSVSAMFLPSGVSSTGTKRWRHEKAGRRLVVLAVVQK